MAADLTAAAGLAPAAPARLRGVDRRRVLVLFVLPALAFTLGMLVVPLVLAGLQSLRLDTGTASLAAYRELLGSGLFRRVLWTTAAITVSAILLSLAIAYPVALWVARMAPGLRQLVSALLLLPLWTSILVKNFAFIVIFGHVGMVAALLRRLGVEPPVMMFNRFGVLVGLVHFFVPFMVFPILSSLQQRDPALEKAAMVMGARPAAVFLRVVLPLSLPGILAAVLMATVLCLGFFVTAVLMGGRGDVMIANLIDFYSREIFDWSAASAAAMLLLAFSLVCMLLAAGSPAAKRLLAEG